MVTHSTNVNINTVKKILKKNTNYEHKGESGRICIVGGSKDYSGAPYLTGMASMRTGADLCFIWTSSDASTAIKSYSPDLIVSPILDEILTMPTDDLKSKLRSMDVLVIGPGFGRSDFVGKVVKLLVQIAVELNKLLVLDADSLFYFESYKDLISNYSRCILTPNYREVKYLLPPTQEKTTTLNDAVVDTFKATLPNNTILCKGKVDFIVNGSLILTCKTKGGDKRCGGQGDILAGVVAMLFLRVDKDSAISSGSKLSLDIVACLAYEACHLMRSSARKAYKKYGMSITSADILGYLYTNLKKLYRGSRFALPW